jgi:hypothetical protein
VLSHQRQRLRRRGAWDRREHDPGEARRRRILKGASVFWTLALTILRNEDLMGWSALPRLVFSRLTIVLQGNYQTTSRNVAPTPSRPSSALPRRSPPSARPLDSPTLCNWPPAIYKLILTPVHAADRPYSPSSDAHPGAQAGSPWSPSSTTPSTNDFERGRASSTSPSCSGMRLRGLRHFDGHLRLHRHDGESSHYDSITSRRTIKMTCTCVKVTRPGQVCIFDCVVSQTERTYGDAHPC